MKVRLPHVATIADPRIGSELDTVMMSSWPVVAMLATELSEERQKDAAGGETEQSHDEQVPDFIPSTKIVWQEHVEGIVLQIITQKQAKDKS